MTPSLLLLMMKYIALVYPVPLDLLYASDRVNKIAQGISSHVHQYRPAVHGMKQD